MAAGAAQAIAKVNPAARESRFIGMSPVMRGANGHTLRAATWLLHFGDIGRTKLSDEYDVLFDGIRIHPEMTPGPVESE
ncbi:hypothetical protein C7E12_01460 [Stenotrophomonas maltophilia]|nr:hypothetical protein C7E12_01460 [Stenotrophomonas maltophilia]